MQSEVIRAINAEDSPCFVAQNFHQDGPHTNDPEGDYTDSRSMAAAAAAVKPGKKRPKSGGGGAETAAQKQQKTAKAAAGAAAAAARAKKKASGGPKHLAPYAVNVFIPLVDITAENGGTEMACRR